MDSADIRIVLVATSHPGNIGAVARAMKNMALSELLLVNPRQFPHAEATARASAAADVLGGVRVVGSLAEALAGCGFIAATTAREREQHFRVMDVREARLHQLVGHDLHRHPQVERRIDRVGRTAHQRVRRFELLVGEPGALGAEQQRYR